MKKILLFLVLISNVLFSQMPDISNVWLNNGKTYTGTIGSKDQQIKLKIYISEQARKNDQEYFVSGYTMVDKNYTKFEGKFKIKKYRDSGKKELYMANMNLPKNTKESIPGCSEENLYTRFGGIKTAKKLNNNI